MYLLNLYFNKLIVEFHNLCVLLVFPPFFLIHQNTIEGKMQSAHDWLLDPSALVGSLGELSHLILLAYIRSPFHYLRILTFNLT